MKIIACTCNNKTPVLVSTLWRELPKTHGRLCAHLIWIKIADFVLKLSDEISIIIALNEIYILQLCFTSRLVNSSCQQDISEMPNWKFLKFFPRYVKVFLSQYLIFSRRRQWRQRLQRKHKMWKSLNVNFGESSQKHRADFVRFSAISKVKLSGWNFDYQRHKWNLYFWP